MEAALFMKYYRAQYVSSARNLADGPSQNNVLCAHSSRLGFVSGVPRLIDITCFVLCGAIPYHDAYSYGVRLTTYDDRPTTWLRPS